MNGKAAKLLRKINSADKRGKRTFNSLDHNEKGDFRRMVEEHEKTLQASEQGLQG